jgi:uncharacterized membrane protein
MENDVIYFLISCILLLTYYLHLERRSRQEPNSSVHALNAKVREEWVGLIMSKPNLEILAVQTLRNSVMAANFMASTSILLIIGTLNISDKIGQWSLQWHPYDMAQNFSTELWKVKLGLLLFDFSIAFFCFSMAIRFYNHVGYMINLSCTSSTDNDLCKKTCAYLNRAGRYYTYGTRTFFISLPIILWFFGPYILILSTLVLIAGLAMLDKVPK